MTSLTGSRPDAGSQAGSASAPHRPRRRNAPLAVDGALLAAGCPAVFAAGRLHAGHREPVLAVAWAQGLGRRILARGAEAARALAAGHRPLDAGAGRRVRDRLRPAPPVSLPARPARAASALLPRPSSGSCALATAAVPDASGRVAVPGVAGQPAGSAGALAGA